MAAVVGPGSWHCHMASMDFYGFLWISGSRMSKERIVDSRTTSTPLISISYMNLMPSSERLRNRLAAGTTSAAGQAAPRKESGSHGTQGPHGHPTALDLEGTSRRVSRGRSSHLDRQLSCDPLL